MDRPRPRLLAHYTVYSRRGESKVNAGLRINTGIYFAMLVLATTTMLDKYFVQTNSLYRQLRMFEKVNGS